MRLRDYHIFNVFRKSVIKIIITDFSQIISAVVYMGEAAECAKNPSTESKNLIKHSIINSVRANFVLHKKRYGQMVLACDSRSWRYDVFPQYKHSRKVKRDNDTSGIKWDFVNEVKEEVIDDLNKFFPFPVINVNKAEGDDCIAVIAKLISSMPTEEDIFGNSDPEDLLIISSDHDCFQLHALGKHVKQWSPMDKKMVKPSIPIAHSLLEKIIKGDTGDGVMNFRMGDNTFIDGIRQKPVSQKTLDKFFASDDPINECETEEERKNFLRNEQLVSFAKIPQDIKESIISCYNEQATKKHSKMNLMNYFTQKRMGNLLSQISDFYI